MLRRRLLRLFVTLATFAVVWMAASVARADVAAHGAPWCDPRGAIGFAPPPQLQDPLQSLDITTNDDDCTESPLAIRYVGHDSPGPQIDVSSSEQPARDRDAFVVADPSATARLNAPAGRAETARAGFRSTVDRPPRP